MAITVEFYAGTPDETTDDVREAFETFVKRIEELGGQDFTGHAELAGSEGVARLHVSDVLTPNQGDEAEGTETAGETPAEAGETEAELTPPEGHEVADGTPHTPEAPSGAPSGTETPANE